MIEVTHDLLADLAEAASQAPPGPWFESGAEVHGSSHVQICKCSGQRLLSVAAAHFIATADPEVVASLVRHIRSLECPSVGQ